MIRTSRGILSAYNINALRRRPSRTNRVVAPSIECGTGVLVPTPVPRASAATAALTTTQIDRRPTVPGLHPATNSVVQLWLPIHRAPRVARSLCRCGDDAHRALVSSNHIRRSLARLAIAASPPERWPRPLAIHVPVVPLGRARAAAEPPPGSAFMVSSRQTPPTKVRDLAPLVRDEVDVPVRPWAASKWARSSPPRSVRPVPSRCRPETILIPGRRVGRTGVHVENAARERARRGLTARSSSR